MKKSLIPALALVIVFVTACSSAGSPDRSGTIHIEAPVSVDVADIPLLMAIDLLRDQGYTVETTALDSALGPAAMAQGDLDFASFSNLSAWSAIGKGAQLVTVMDKSAVTYMLITSKGIQTCEDLHGKSVAIGDVATINATMLRLYLETNCPNTKPEMVIVKGGRNRMAALLTGEVDAAMQEIEHLVRFERDRPGEFHALIVLAKEFPGLQLNSHVARRDFAEQHPEMVKDVIRALFTARRRLQDAQVLRDEIIKYLELEPDEAQQLADTYLEQEIWDASGTYTLETVQAIVEFSQQYGELPPELTAKDVADLSYYDAVLDEIGRQ